MISFVEVPIDRFILYDCSGVIRNQPGVELDLDLTFLERCDGSVLIGSQKWLDNIIANQITIANNIIQQDINPNLIARAHGFLGSVLWTDTSRVSTFTSDPVAIVVMKGESYAGHVYVWPEDEFVPQPELHVLGLRKTLDVKVKIRLMPLVFKFVESYAQRHGYGIVRVHDPVSVVPKYLKNRGYEATGRWHDLSVGMDVDEAEQSDYIKQL